MNFRFKRSRMPRSTCTLVRSGPVFLIGQDLSWGAYLQRCVVEAFVHEVISTCSRQSSRRERELPVPAGRLAGYRSVPDPTNSIFELQKPKRHDQQAIQRKAPEVDALGETRALADLRAAGRWSSPCTGRTETSSQTCCVQSAALGAVISIAKACRVRIFTHAGFHSVSEDRA